MPTIVEGRSAPFQRTLKNNGATFDATGFSAAIDMEDKDGNAVTPDVSWGLATASLIQIDDPSSLTEAASPYSYRWKVTDGSGDIQYYPGGQWEPSQLVVVPVRP